VHVVSNLKQALKAESVGCDAVVAEGVEAGGHNGADEIPMIDLISQLVDKLKIPIIAAGGIADKTGIEQTLSLGAEGVQIGTLFAATKESSAHINYKNAVVNAEENDTALIFRAIGLIRGIRNPFLEKVIALERKGATNNELKKLLGTKREKLGIFEGNFAEGILEAGEGIATINKICSVSEIFNKLV
jgi:enoyl-[acyl-carrier protein] reductase II